MKVQVKVTGNPRIKNQYNVEDVGERYYVIADEHGMLTVVAKKDYEPVEEWVDVTDECHISESGGHSMLIMHNGYQVGTAAATACFSLYRLKATGSHGIRVERKKA